MKKIYSLILLLVIMCLPTTVRTNITVHHETLTTNYYWFDTSGNYLRQNTLADEMWLTMYDEIQASPFTLREKGYNPANCYGGSPPVPIDPDLPDKLLYSHP